MAHRLSLAAEHDLDSIWSYVARSRGSPNAADRLIELITERFYLLSLNPYIGRRRDEDLRPGMRSFPVGEFIILYRVEEDEVIILKVVSGKRDVQALMS